ncbi:MAG: hypothetical protein ACYCUM_06855 [Solirubrobacteraceae bacterium]
MSGPLSEERIERALAELAPTLRPLRAETDDGGRRRRIQNVLLVIVGIVLATAVLYDVARQVNINYRLTADIETWREITGHRYKNVSVETDTHHYTTKDVACGNVFYNKPGHSVQICFVLVGPILHRRIGGRIVRRRATYGGFFVPRLISTGYKVNRYGCFGHAVAEDRCKLATPAGKPHVPPPGFAAELRAVSGAGG